eukprot:TRINITY_DN16264_c0_g1_i1.p1 TRINITY_DN16264_c0_g1~~TRINITY_DN16264_c0_g1_i1.p1  ORF type:complete len:573 (+),score=50.67 TRINITY_DN16264_c0_g1_i1:111-1829(+)
MIQALLSAPGGFNGKEVSSESEGDSESAESDDFTDCESFTSDFVPRRGKKDSWKNMPHSKRGITLQELQNLYAANRDWLDERHWQCARCGTRSPGLEGPCVSAHCDSEEGEPKKRNLYEVNTTLIRPLCADSRVSYVEMLSITNKRRRHASIDTFVSHWWGEEFDTLVLSLTKYAEMQCYSERHWISVFASYSMAGIILPPFLRFFGFYRHTARGCRMQMGVWEPMVPLYSKVPLQPCTEDVWLCFVLCVLVSFIVYLCTQHVGRNPRTWSFWICAFANNQYALQHALGGEDVGRSSFATAMRARSCKDVVALLDSTGEIYRRAWCAFELFYASIVLPRHYGQRVGIKLINDHGIVSKADCSNDVVENMAHMIEDVRTADAKASVARDRTMIRAAMYKEGITFEDLDEALRNIARTALCDVRKKSWAPLVVFTLFPVASTGIAINLYDLVIADNSIVDDVGKRVAHLLLWISFVTLATLVLPIKITAVLSIIVPTLFSFVFEAFAHHMCNEHDLSSSWCRSYDLGLPVFIFVTAQAQAMCLVGFFFGCCYLLIRRYGCARRFRRRVDAIFFT